MATLRLDLSACLVPQVVEAPGCGDALKERFADQGDGAIPACLAVASAQGGEGATLPLAVSSEDGTLTPRGGAALALPGGGGTWRSSFSSSTIRIRACAIPACSSPTGRATPACPVA